ncbi:MAG: hypothetical protein KF773_06490 [Deltaproteobacteria bacterium]|nr:hypothetical protein [Deltaproteobacteria bacterium]
MRRLFAVLVVLVVVTAGCGRAPLPPVAPTAPAPVPAAAPAPAQMRVKASGTAKDDLPHLRAQLAWLERVGDCIPQDRELSLALDAYDGKLVACVQVMTRRDVSVMLDPVNYACWDVDPATGQVAKRRDLGRAYFDCRDGACPPGETRRFVSYDGTAQVLASETELTIARRPGDAPVRTLPFTMELFLRGSVTYVGARLFVLDPDGPAVHVLDDRSGKAIDKLDGISVHVVDGGHVLVGGAGDEDHILYDLVSGKRTKVIRGAEYLETMVALKGAYYAVDGEARRLVALDPRTLQPQRSLPLRTCPVTP